MQSQDIAYYRLMNQQISINPSKTPEQVVSSLGAMQAQDYNASLWAIGLRIRNSKKSDIEKAIIDRTIVRTWPMRGTLHFVPAVDAHWMLKLMTPRTIAGAIGREKNLGLDKTIFDKARKILTKALEKDKQLTNKQMLDALEKSGISTAEYRGRHIIGRFAQEGIISFGNHDDKQPTFVLLDEWIKKHNNPSHEQAVSEIAKRFFSSHGPATLQDFVRWTGLRVSEAKKGIESLNFKSEKLGKMEYYFPRPKKKPGIKSTYLLPAFDEYVIGYKDRADILHPMHSDKIVPGGNGMFLPTIVIDGQVVGTWKKQYKKNGIAINLNPFRKLSKDNLESISKAADRYGRFLGMKIVDLK